MASLLDKIGEQEKQAEKKPSAKKSHAVNKLSANAAGQKDKQISAKVNTQTYTLFTEINQAQGLSNNSALNMLISRYVRENRELIE